jgi:hypothetical protein
MISVQMRAQRKRAERESSAEAEPDDFISLKDFASAPPSTAKKRKLEHKDDDAESKEAAGDDKLAQAKLLAESQSDPRARAPWAGREYMHTNFTLRFVAR